MIVQEFRTPEAATSDNNAQAQVRAFQKAAQAPTGLLVFNLKSASRSACAYLQFTYALPTR
jgi:hypothetical protein